MRPFSFWGVSAHRLHATLLGARAIAEARAGLGGGAADLVVILESLKQAGALQAEMVVL